MYDLTASIVAHKNDPEVLRKTISCLLNTALNARLYLVDNSPSGEMRDICQDSRIDYIFNDKNVGFGRGHNIAIHKSMNESKYHLVMNPDIFFENGTLERCRSFLEENREIGLLMPKICYFDGRIQYLCKLLPAPFDLAARRLDFEIIRILFKNRLDRYTLRYSGYDSIMDVPHLSGCFMFIRQEVFKKVGLFDERFFMYLEDVDFSRRIHKYYRTVYYPEAVVYHQHAQHSYSDKTAFKYHIYSAIKYFNKWGWFFDMERREVNRVALEKLQRGAG